MLKLELCDKYLPQVTDLYKKAFPAKERISKRRWDKLLKNGKADLLIFTDNNVFVGFSYLLLSKERTYIFFLAMDNNLRNKGYGSKALKLIEEYYKNNQIILCSETPKENVSNKEQRIRRKEFYYRNGYKDSGLMEVMSGENFDIMLNKGTITDKEYLSLISCVTNKLFFKLIYSVKEK